MVEHGAPHSRLVSAAIVLVLMFCMSTAQGQVVTLKPGTPRNIEIKKTIQKATGRIGQIREVKDSVLEVYSDAPVTELAVAKLKNNKGIALRASGLAGGRTYEVAVTYNLRVEEFQRIGKFEKWILVEQTVAEELLTVVVDLNGFPTIRIPVGSMIPLVLPDTLQVTRIHPKRKKNLEVEWEGNVIRLKGKKAGQQKIDIQYRIASKQFRQRYVRIVVTKEHPKLSVRIVPGGIHTIRLADLEPLLDLEILRLHSFEPPPTIEARITDTQVVLTGLTGDETEQTQGQGLLFVLGNHKKDGETLVPVAVEINLN